MRQQGFPARPDTMKTGQQNTQCTGAVNRRIRYINETPAWFVSWTAGYSQGGLSLSDTNGCYRLHPVEWNIGEAAGQLAAFCMHGNHAPIRNCWKISGNP